VVNSKSARKFSRPREIGEAPHQVPVKNQLRTGRRENIEASEEEKESLDSDSEREEGGCGEVSIGGENDERCRMCRKWE
jgi:hypothetical protein